MLDNPSHNVSGTSSKKFVRKVVRRIVKKKSMTPKGAEEMEKIHYEVSTKVFDKTGT
jgi:hypothetical protein